MHKVNILTAMKITKSVACFLMETDHYHVAAGFLREWLWLVNYFESVMKIESKEMGSAKSAAHLILVVIYWREGKKEESKENAELSLKISRQIADKDGELRSCMILPRVLYGLGRYEEAIDYCKEALSISQEIGDAKAEAQILYSLGLIFKYLGQKQQAVDFLQKSVEKSKDTGERRIEGKALIELGDLIIHLGKCSETYQKAARALEISKQIKDRKMEAEALFSLGLALYKLNKPRQSLLKLEDSLKISEEIGDHISRVRTLNIVGVISRFYGPYGTSMECCRKALQVSKEIHYRNLEGISYLNLGDMLIDRQKYEEAGQCLENSLEISKETGDRDMEEVAGSFLCNLHLKLGQHDKAREYKELVVKRVYEAGPRKITIPLAVECLHAPERFSIEENLRISSEIIRSYESEREPLSDEYKISIADITPYIYVYKRHCSDLIILGKFVDALCTAERGRARVLTEQLAKKYAIQEKFEFRKGHLSSLTSQLMEEQVLVFIAIYTDKTLFWVMKDDEPNVALIRKPCRAHDVLEAYTAPCLSQGRDVECEDRSLSALYDSESTTADEDENKQQQMYRLPRENGKLNAPYTPTLNQLYNVLIAPFADRIQGRELVLVPEGAMFMVPFAAMQDDFGKYLSETCKIRIIPSLSTLKLIYDSPADYHSQTGALIVGDPKVNHITPLAPLPAARQEAQEIADLFMVAPLLDEQATKEEVLRRITDVCLIHIAAHGDAERGEIACAPNPSSPQVPRKEDYMLTMEDIAKVRIRAKLVVLSCCHSGKGEIMKAEGVVGIGRAFIAAGARSVLVSLWRLNDESTKEFMTRFYGHLVRDKVSASEALHQTMKWMRKFEQYDESDWAPFVLIGDDVTLDF